jgi:hypothetical protein
MRGTIRDPWLFELVAIGYLLFAVCHCLAGKGVDPIADSQ